MRKPAPPPRPDAGAPADDGTAARAAALKLLAQVLEEGRLLDEGRAGGPLERLDGPDRARALRLAADCLRGLERADRLLAPHLRKPPPLPVQNALRLGTVEICTGAAPHGVVNALVTIVGRQRRHGHLKGLVNAVLRKIAAAGPPAWDRLRVPRLPGWLRAPLVDAWGRAGVAAMEAAHFAAAPLDLTPRADAPADLAERLGARRLPTGSLRLDDPGQVTALPGYAEGHWWVQDAAAALPARILAPRPGEAVLDLCAAPGGKTLQLADAGARVTALDISERRLGRLAENLARTGLGAEIVAGDALAFGGAGAAGAAGYDAVLLDAPCSATGTIRRHPDLPHAKDGAEFAALFELQAALIDRALALLRPGGRLVFCTCSLLPDEGEVQLEAALDRHPGLAVDRAALALPGVDPGWITPEGGLRLRPDHWAEAGGMDGFFIALLRKPG